MLFRRAVSGEVVVGTARSYQGPSALLALFFLPSLGASTPGRRRLRPVCTDSDSETGLVGARAGAVASGEGAARNYWDREGGDDDDDDREGVRGWARRRRRRRRRRSWTSGGGGRTTRSRKKECWGRTPGPSRTCLSRTTGPAALPAVPAVLSSAPSRPPPPSWPSRPSPPGRLLDLRLGRLSVSGSASRLLHRSRVLPRFCISASASRTLLLLHPSGDGCPAESGVTSSQVTVAKPPGAPRRLR